jgi:uroporphyrinogen decarboxylase
MNGRERVMTALSIGVPDRVPHLELAYNESSIVEIARCFTEDVPEPDYIQRMDLGSRVRLFEAALLMIEELDVDGLTLRIFPEHDVLDEKHVRDDWGVTFQLSPWGEAIVVSGPIRDESDLRGYRPPQIKESDLGALSYCVQRFKGVRANVLSLQDPFRRSWNLLGGMPELLICYGTNPSLVHQLARIVTDYTLDAVALGAELGADVISMDGDLAHETTMLMSPKHFREFIKPRYAEIVEFVHAKGLKIFKHTDGNHWKIMEDLIEVGFDGIHPIQPQSLNLAEVKREIGDRICLLGNIDCRETLVSKSTQEVEEEVIRAIQAAASGGGYILSSSNTIHPEVRAENYIAMVKATHKHGVYGTHGGPTAAGRN